MNKSHLFSPFQIRGVEFRNRIMMSPMCMYSAGEDGLATPWHQVHYATRANGGAGLLMLEATAVEARGRISRNDLGLWDDIHIEPLSRIVRLVHEAGAAIGVQLAHAGRKAWSSEKGHGPFTPVAPSPIAYDDDWRQPDYLTETEIEVIIDAWEAAALRAQAAGFDVIEIHAAHGYLNHEFLSPLTNQRTDEYGGDLTNRMTLLTRVINKVRRVWPKNKPLFVRISASDWADGGLTCDDHVIVAAALKEMGVDVIDCSAGGLVPFQSIVTGPGYQVPYAEKIRKANIPTIAVGLITKPELAEEIVFNGRADMVALGRELLRNPYWPLSAARELGQQAAWPEQYLRARK